MWTSWSFCSKQSDWTWNSLKISIREPQMQHWSVRSWGCLCNNISAPQLLSTSCYLYANHSHLHEKVLIRMFPGGVGELWEATVTVLTFNGLCLFRKRKSLGIILYFISLSTFIQQIYYVRLQIFDPALKTQACFKVRGTVPLMAFTFIPYSPYTYMFCL